MALMKGSSLTILIKRVNVVVVSHSLFNPPPFLIKTVPFNSTVLMYLINVDLISNESF